MRDSRALHSRGNASAGMPVITVSTPSSQCTLRSSRCGNSTGGGSNQGGAAAPSSDIEAPQEELPQVAIKPPCQRFVAMIEARIDPPAHLRDRQRRLETKLDEEDLGQRSRVPG